jgi:opacity protein-like surface antigen
MKYLLLCFLIPLVGFSQPLNMKGGQGGIVSFGVRTTFSAFNDGLTGNVGTGVGGQFRLQFADKVNSDWFFDYITSDIGGFANRTDYHIGWSVLFYPGVELTPRFRPYVLAGHCFDYSRLEDNSNRNNFDERWSSAVQGGLGVHYNLTQRLDLSAVCQYMVHLGNHVHAEKENGLVVFHNEKGASLEGHLLFHFGINYKIGDLW